MIEVLAKLVVVAAGSWLIVVGLLMLARPKTALYGLSKAASTNLINYGELSLRLVAGLAMMAAADASRSPDALQIFGGFIAATAVVLMFIPRPWHARYAAWWAERLSPAAVRLAAPVSLVGGLLLIYAVS